MSEKVESKNVRKVRTVVDTSRPLSTEVKSNLMSTSNDCFGKLLDLETRECQVCADNELCTLLFKDIVDKKVAKFEDAKGPMLDVADLSLIDQDRLYEDMQKHSGSITTAEVLERIKKESRLTDDVALIEWLKRFKERRKFTVKKGIIYV